MSVNVKCSLKGSSAIDKSMPMYESQTNSIVSNSNSQVRSSYNNQNYDEPPAENSFSNQNLQKKFTNDPLIELICERDKEIIVKDQNNDAYQTLTYFLDNKPSGDTKQRFLKEQPTQLEDMKKLNTKEVNEQIDKMRKTIRTDCEEIKDKIVQRKTEEIKILEDAFKDFKNCNENILDLFSFIHTERKPEDLTDNMITNRLKYSKFTLKKLNPKDEIEYDELLEYFKKARVTPLESQAQIQIIEPKKINFQSIISKKIIPKGALYNIITLPNGKLATCSNADNIKIYNESCQEIYTLTGPNNELHIAHYITLLSNDTFASCSKDNMKNDIFIWDSNNYKLLSYKKSNIRGINSIKGISNYNLAVCGKDGTIDIWKYVEPYSCTKSFHGHNAQIVSIEFMEKYDLLISGSWEDESIKLWNCNNFELVKDLKLKNSTPFMNSLCILDDRVIVGEKDAITFIDISGKTDNGFFGGEYNFKQETFHNDNFKLVCSFCKVRDGKIICGCSKGIVYIIEKGGAINSQSFNAFSSGDVQGISVISEDKVAMVNDEGVLGIFSY